MNDILIAYFSKSGRTKKIAEFIASEINAPLHEIITAKKYPKTYIMTILEARKEFKRNDKPTITTEIENFDSYNKILLGFPIWWFTCPQVIISFLEKYDFSGKKIFPFCTSGGSNCEKATEKIRELCKNSQVFDGIKANSLDKSKISEWLKDII